MTPNSSPLTPYIALIGAGYWGKNLVRNFHELGVLKTICDQSSPGRPAPRPGDAGPRCLQTLLNTASSKSPWPHLSLTERRFLEAGIGTRGVRRKDKADPVYYNTGSCVHPRCITGIEITAAPPKDDGPIRPHFTLVKWGYLEEKPGRLPRKNRGDSAEEKPGRLPIFSFRKIGSCTGFSGPQDGSCTGFSGPQAGSK